MLRRKLRRALSEFAEFAEERSAIIIRFIRLFLFLVLFFGLPHDIYHLYRRAVMHEIHSQNPEHSQKTSRLPVSLIETVLCPKTPIAVILWGCGDRKVVDSNLPRRLIRYRDFPIKTIAWTAHTRLRRLDRLTTRKRRPVTELPPPPALSGTLESGVFFEMRFFLKPVFGYCNVWKKQDKQILI